MGTLAGHLMIANSFLLLGLWWSFVTSLRLIQSSFMVRRSKRDTYEQHKYRATFTMPFIISPWKVLRETPFESVIKIIVLSIAITSEAYTGFHFKIDPVSNEPTWSWYIIKPNQQHLTIYSIFLLGGVFEMFLYLGVNFPQKLDFSIGALSFIIEAFMFSFHVHGKEMSEVHLHLLLLYATIGCAVFCMLEMYNTEQVLFTYGRILCTILQGTWLYQIAFMLYPPWDNPDYKWDLTSHDFDMTISILFSWHIMIIIAGLAVEYGVLKFAYFNTSSYLQSRFDELIEIDIKWHQRRQRVSLDEKIYVDLDETISIKKTTTNHVDSEQEALI